VGTVHKVLIATGVVVLLVAAAVGTAYRSPLWLADQVVRFHLWRSGVKSEYLTINGNRIHYLEARPGSGVGGGERPLVLIHGLGARGEDWAPMIPGLAAAGYHVYVPDLLGYGRSARPDVGYSIRMEEDLLAKFMAAEHVERADVAGWSMGGWVAMRLAAEHPAMVKRLVVFDSAGVYFPGGFALEAVFDAKDEAGAKRLFGMLTPNPKPIPPFVARDLVRRIQGNIWVLKRSLRSMMRGRDSMDFRLGSIRQPTLVVWGKQDELIPLAAGETIHRGIAGSSLLVVDGCGHLTPAECSKVSMAATVEFLRAEPAIVGGERVVDGRQ